MSPAAQALIVEPDDGLEPVRELIGSARESLLVKQFTFTDETLLDAVLERYAAGVAVRVMLNPARSGGDRANDETYERLRAAGVDVQWTNPQFYVTHEKSVVVDGRAALVATFNLCTKYFTRTRDYGLITCDPDQVAQIAEVFEADWSHGDWVPSADHGLLWSNSNSRRQMAHFIDGARDRLDVQHPKYVDAVILEHLAAAADRGVKVHVLCGGRHGISEWDVLDTFATLRLLRRFGVKVHKMKNHRVHAKLLIADGSRALLGSMNIDRSAFDLRRELGVTTDDPAVVARLQQVFDEDWAQSHSYHPPDPLDPTQHHEDDAHEFHADATLVHE
ncbi:phospholipase D-like domain-containing protein [Mycobacterium sp. WMMD1722]|uniref:phospholipase D-like domain-containing protein n=1 Tax=Mycobacterium sp. WMMD1722 TaxID=3404117 RepID=UPI003BF53270